MFDSILENLFLAFRENRISFDQLISIDFFPNLVLEIELGIEDLIIIVSFAFIKGVLQWVFEKINWRVPNCRRMIYCCIVFKTCIHINFLLDTHCFESWRLCYCVIDLIFARVNEFFLDLILYSSHCFAFYYYLKNLNNFSKSFEIENLLFLCIMNRNRLISEQSQKS